MQIESINIENEKNKFHEYETRPLDRYCILLYYDVILKNSAADIIIICFKSNSEYE